MKLKVTCPYCNNDEFEQIDEEYIECQTCGEELGFDEIGFEKIIEEN